MTYSGDIDLKSKDLEKHRDLLLDSLKKLEEKHKQGKVSEEDYRQKKHKIERSFVEIMDRLAQIRFRGGQK